MKVKDFIKTLGKIKNQDAEIEIIGNFINPDDDNYDVPLKYEFFYMDVAEKENTNLVSLFAYYDKDFAEKTMSYADGVESMNNIIDSLNLED